MKKVLNKIFKYTLLAVIVIVFVGTIVYLYQKSQKEPDIYETVSPKITNIVKKTVATGSVIPRKEIDIKPQVSGIVEKMYVEAGQFVKKGDLIAKVKIIPNMINLNEAESRLKRANLNFEDIKIIYERQKALFDKKVIAESEFQQNILAFNSAKEEIDAAENNLQLIKEGVRKDAGQATNTLIHSTIEGMVLNVPIKEGNSVIESNTFNDGTTIATVADMGEMIFLGKVDESEVGRVKKGMDLVLSIGAIENVTFKAKLEYISPKGIDENGAIKFEIKAAIVLIDSIFIRSGYSANADIVLSKKDKVLSIQESLIKFEKDSAFVEVQTAPQKFEKRYIKTGLSDGLNIEVLSGLKKTDKVKGNLVDLSMPPPVK